MNIDRAVMAFAGTVIVVSVIMAHYISAWWLLLTLFVGLNLFQASFTGFCPLAIFLRKIGLNSGTAFD